VTSSLMTCVTRNLGESTWEDYLVLADRWGTRMREWLPQHLDDLLSGREDWLEPE